MDGTRTGAGPTGREGAPDQSGAAGGAEGYRAAEGRWDGLTLLRMLLIVNLRF